MAFGGDAELLLWFAVVVFTILTRHERRRLAPDHLYRYSRLCHIVINLQRCGKPAMHMFAAL